MKLYAVCTEGNKKLLNEWFLPSMMDRFDVNVIELKGTDDGDYMSNNYVKILAKKHDIVIDAIKENWGNVFIFSDVDIQFFKPVEKDLLTAIDGHDIVCMRDSPGDRGQLCAGFFVCRANWKALSLWKLVKGYAVEEKRDQIVFNRIVLGSNSLWGRLRYSCPKIKYNYLPQSYFSGGAKTEELWEIGMNLTVPHDIAVHHANWTVGIEKKIAQLEYVKGIVESRKSPKTES